MGGVVKTISNVITGGGDTQVSGAAANPTLGNSGNSNLNFGQQVANQQGTPYSQFLAQQLNPNAPTIAQAQLRAATDQNLANQAAMQASAHGANVGTSQLQAAHQAAATGQQAAQQNAILALQEQQQNAQNALQYRGLNNQYAESLYGLGNQRDLGLMNAQVQGGLGAAGISEQDKQRNQKGFSDFLGNAAKGAGMLFTGGASAAVPPVGGDLPSPDTLNMPTFGSSLGR